MNKFPVENAKMYRSWPDKIIEILSIGHSLKESGTNNWVLTRTQALDALNRFERINIAILGGDVYQIVSGKFVHTYVNWYFEPEDKIDYVRSSIDFSRKFIENLDGIENPMFLLVPKRS